MKPADTTSELNLDLLFVRTSVRVEVAWYKWEFLRRNPEYIADYRIFLEEFGSWFDRNGYWYDRKRRAGWTKADLKEFKAKIRPVIVGLCREWKIGDLLPPHWRFNKQNGLRRVADIRVGLPTLISPELSSNSDVRHRLEDLGFTGTGDRALRHGHLLQVEFDLNWPLKDLLDQAKHVLRLGKGSYHGQVRVNGVRTSASRRRLVDYEMHLKAWDLQRKKSVPEIASLLFRHEAPDSAQQKVRDHLKAAKKLIEGGYAEIS